MKTDRVMAWIQCGDDSRAASLPGSPRFPFPMDVAVEPAVDQVIDRLARDPRDVLLIEDATPFRRTNLFLKKTEELHARPVIIVLARDIDVPAAVSLMESGVFTVVSGEFTAEQVASVVSRAFANRRAFEKIMDLSDSLRHSEGTIETLNVQVAHDRDRLSKVNEELNFLLRLALSLHEDPDLDAVFEWLCRELRRFVPYLGVELVALPGVPTVRTCGFTGTEGARGLLDRHGIPVDGVELVAREFPAPADIQAVKPPALGETGSRRWEALLLFGATRLGVLAVDLPGTFTGGGERLLRSVAAQLSLFLHNTLEREKVREMATHDGLTGLYNFRSFREIFGREFERFLRYGCNLTLMMIDLDNFKGVNDTFGHQAGDKVLQHVAEIVQRNLRKTDYGFRYGGDEFIVLLPDQDANSSEALARRILAAVRKQVRGVSPFPFSLSLSIGIADCGTIVSQEGEELLRKADGALYRAKERGKDRIVIAEPAAARAAGAGGCDALV